MLFRAGHIALNRRSLSRLQIDPADRLHRLTGKYDIRVGAQDVAGTVQVKRGTAKLTVTRQVTTASTRKQLQWPRVEWRPAHLTCRILLRVVSPPSANG